MDVVSTCPLCAGSIVWQPRPSAWTLTVIVKATFVLTPGESRLAEVQDELNPQDRLHGGDEARSLHAATDLVPWKPRADVVLVGSAFAPQRRPARLVATRLNVGEIDKRIDVWCDRVFWKDGRLLEGQPFVKMPLVHERAAGGPATTNPVGLRADAAPDAYGSVPIPNLQPPGRVVARPGDTFAPIAYGPLAPTWPGRADKLPRQAAGWSQSQLRASPLPAGFDLAHFNSAPLDQQIAAIRADERILLENLHADHPLLVTRLPGLTPRAHLMAGNAVQEAIELTADTLWIDTDRGLATVVWRGRFALSHAQEEGRIVVSMAASGAERAPAVSSDARSAAEDPTMLGDLGGANGGTAQLDRAELATILGNLRSLEAPALPFKAPPSAWVGFSAKPEASPERSLPEDTGTMYGALNPTRAPLPFVEPFASRAVDSTPAPAWIGPLATVDSVPPEAEPAPPVVDAGGAPVAEVNDDVPAPPAREPVEEYPIERCAAITASIARRRAERAQILDDHGLDPARWAGLEQHWNDAILKEMTRGKTDLLQAFDAAYLAQIEAERGPLEVGEYARLLVASERGTLGEVLAELTLPRGAMMRIERVWLSKLADDRALEKSVRSAVSAAREA